MRTQYFPHFPLSAHAQAGFALLFGLLGGTAPAMAFPIMPDDPAVGAAQIGAEPYRPDAADQFAQAYGRPQQPRGRPVSDQDHALDSARSGENRSFDELMRSAQSRGRGEYLGVEPDISRNIYRFKFMRPGGNVVWVDVDGRTARVVSERD